MKQNHDNRSRAFAEVISLEAWHDAFDENTKNASLHADVVFREGRLGGEASSKVRFKLSIRRAEIVVIVPETEPVKIDPKSVSRDSPQFIGTSTIRVTSDKKAGGAVKVESKLATTGVKVKIEGRVEAAASLDSSRSIEAIEAYTRIRVVQTKTADDNYRWEVHPNACDALEGRPWDANNQPRLTLVDQRANRSKGIPPVVRIEVRCLREDLRITDIELKDENLWKRINSKKNIRNNMVAAESYIRDRLVNEGLEFGDLSESYAEIILARISAMSNGG